MRPDSAHLASGLGTIAAFTLADAAHSAGIFCALTGAGYTIWKWWRESRTHRPALPPHAP